MIRDELADLSAFATVAEERSFTRAAARIGISQSALSHSLRGLERHLGVQLLARTSRSVSPTAAGAALLRDLGPALERIEQAVAVARQQREKPSGRVRLALPSDASQLVLMPKLARFTWMFPEVVLEITSVNDPIDLVAGEYDAGIQLGEFIQRDMIAVPVTREMRLAFVASPAYFKSNAVPYQPRDLKDHACIGFRFAKGLYRWEFQKGRKSITVSPEGPVSFDDPDLVIQAVLHGIGIGGALEENIKDLISTGRLVQILKDWCPPFPGYFLYYPSRRNQPAALAALIEALRLSS